MPSCACTLTPWSTRRAYSPRVRPPCRPSGNKSDRARPSGRNLEAASQVRYTIETPAMSCSSKCTSTRCDLSHQHHTNVTWEEQLLAETNYSRSRSAERHRRGPASRIRYLHLVLSAVAHTLVRSGASGSTTNCHGCVDGVPEREQPAHDRRGGPDTWNDLVTPPKRPGRREFVQLRERQRDDPETLTLYVAAWRLPHAREHRLRSHDRARHLPGVPALHEPDHERHQPDGSHYSDPGIPWISYFNGVTRCTDSSATPTAGSRASDASRCLSPRPRPSGLHANRHSGDGAQLAGVSARRRGCRAGSQWSRRRL